MGGSLLALPFLESLLPKEALAQSMAIQPRFIMCWTPHGGMLDASIIGEQPGATSVEVYPGHVIRHRALTPNISPVLGSFLNPYIGRMNVLRGLDVSHSIEHSTTAVCGNLSHPIVAPGIPEQATIDQILAYSPKIYSNAQGIVRSIVVHPDAEGSSSVAYATPGALSGPVTAVPHVFNPRAVFNTLFQGGSGTRYNEERTLVDAVFSDYANVRNNPKLSAQDKNIFEGHIAHLQDLQNRLGSAIICEPPSTPPSLAFNSAPTIPTLVQIHQLFNDVIIAAMRCGITRVATIMGTVLDYLADWHGTAHLWHQVAGQSFIADRNRFFVQQILFDLVSKMAAFTESNGKTMLENSLIMWVAENRYPHGIVDQVVVTFGSANGRITTGNYIDYRNLSSSFERGSGGTGAVMRPGFLYNRFLVSVLQAMGLEPQDYERPRVGEFQYGGYGAIKGTMGAGLDEFGFGYQPTTQMLGPAYHVEDADLPLPLLMA
jgi:hypothetical protein